MVSPRGRDLAIWMAVFTFLNIITLVLRFYVLFKGRKRGLRADDFLVVLSFVAMLAMEGTTFWAIHNGLGYPTATLEWPQIAVQIKLLVSAFWTWTIATASCKLAILCLYLEIFRMNKPFRVVVWILMACTAIYVPVFIAFFMTQCDPVWAAWDQVLSQTNCRPRQVHQLISVAVNLVLDLGVVVAPLPIIWGLQMQTSKKVGVSAVFGLGTLVIAIMIWRLVTTATPDDNADLVYDLYILALQSHLELWLGILAVNIPTLGPLIDRKSTSRYVRSLFSGRGSRKASHGASFGTGGSSRDPKSPSHDEFQLLPSGKADPPHNGIVRDLEFRVSIESSPESNSGRQRTG
ncbi:hypothetical protein F5Y04DRAFT_102200 [Hypomontagnella monticulosa]|nr:hypothetical protein F5Y04DRAFT_102200 [Hypomontagnella monticulosa]